MRNYLLTGMQKSNIKMKKYKSKFKKGISHGLTRMNTDIKKYFIVLNKIKFGMGSWVIRVHQWPINMGWGWVIQIFKNMRLSACYSFGFLHFYLSFCFLNFNILFHGRKW
jgi:hypothetical protein